MKKILRRAAHEVKEFLLYFALFASPALALVSLFLTLKGMLMITAIMMAGWFIICVVCYILQTRREKKRAMKMVAKKAAKLKRSEI